MSRLPSPWTLLFIVPYLVLTGIGRALASGPRWRAAKALGQIGHGSASCALESRSGDPDPFVREQAALALHRCQRS